MNTPRKRVMRNFLHNRSWKKWHDSTEKVFISSNMGNTRSISWKYAYWDGVTCTIWVVFSLKIVGRVTDRVMLPLCLSYVYCLPLRIIADIAHFLQAHTCNAQWVTRMGWTCDFFSKFSLFTAFSQSCSTDPTCQWRNMTQNKKETPGII